MTFPTDWDIEKYRVDYECEDHWELRRRFLETHKDKFPEERLVCLAQVFYNVEFMGCRYPEKTMRLVAELSNGVADEHREKMKTKLQRTFVQASEAASTKVKGRSGNEDTAHTKKGPIKFHKSTEEIDNRMTNNNINVNNQDSLPNPHNELPQNPDDAAKLSKKDRLKEKRKRLRKKKKAVENGSKAVLTNSTMESVELTGTLHEGGGEPQDSEQLPNGKNKKKKIKKKKKMVEDAATTAEYTPGRFVIAPQSHFDNDSRPQKRKEIPDNSVPQQPKRMKTSNPFSDFVLMEMETGLSAPYGILSRSAEMARKVLTQHVDKTSNGPVMTLKLGGHTLAKATGSDLNDAKTKCAAEALQMLRESCFTIKLKDRFAGSTVDKNSDSTSAVTGSTSTSTNPASKETPDHLAEDSKVNRMMKLMGWSGGGLGKNQQGREEPVEVVQRVRRVGLGGAAGVTGPEFRTCINEILRKFVESNASHDLVFASDYSKDERAQIHVLARKFQRLKSSSYGKDQNRRLVLSIKKTPQEILSEVLKAGGTTDKYDAIPPGSF